MRSILLALALSMPLAGRAHEGGHDVRGVIASVGADELTIKTSHGEEKFVLTPETEFVKNGAPATAQDLKQSDRAVVHGKKKAGRMEAIKVQFSPSKKR